MPSFDVVSEVDLQELDNALNQVRKEILTRYDFRGSKCEIKQEKSGNITLLAEDDLKIRSISDLLNQKLSKRGISTKNIEYKPIVAAGGSMRKQDVLVKQGISSDEAKKITKSIKEMGIKKVQTQIQGEQLRVTAPKRDDLQQVIAHLKEHVKDIDLQFNNFRD